jgi:AraC-like DNA-binding protein
MSRAATDNHANPRLRTDEPLLWLAGAGHEVRTDQSYYYDCRQRRDRPQVTIQFTLAGTGFYQDRRGRTLLPAGWAFVSVIPGEFEYGFAPQSTGPYELAFISIDGTEATAWHERLVSSFGHLLDLSDAESIRPMLLNIAHARETSRLPDRYVLSAQIYALLMEIYSTLNRTRLSTTPRVTQAMQLIADHADDAGFGIHQLAAAMDCSREHLTRLFRTATGVSPIDYLTQQRLRRAAQALRATNDKLEAIAQRCGFSSANYFCRTFRERVGTTPARFRKQPWLMGP